jgi:hypothetical protein
MSVNPAHRDHDTLLIVRAASGDGDPIDQRQAADQLATCEDCRALAADVAAIRGSLTASVLRVPARPRSFRILADDLDRLRAPAWRRWLGRFGAPSFDLVRPLATAVAGIGLAIAVLGSAGTAANPVTLSGASPAASEAPAEQLAPGAASAPTASDRPFGAVAYPQPSAVPTTGSGAMADSGKGTATPTGAAAAPNPGPVIPAARTTTEVQPAVPLLPIGAVVLVLGLATLLLHAAARRTAGR